MRKDYIMIRQEIVLEEKEEREKNGIFITEKMN